MSVLTRGVKQSLVRKIVACAVGWQMGGRRVHDDVKLSLSEGKEAFSVEFGCLRLCFPSFLQIIRPGWKVSFLSRFFFAISPRQERSSLGFGPAADPPGEASTRQ